MSNGKPLPKINDAYWFDYSKNLVDTAQERREESTEKTTAFIKWLWPIYVAGTAIGFGLSGKALPLWASVLIAIAGAALIFVYWSTLLTWLPRLVEFDPRSPDEIKKAYATEIRSKQKWGWVTVFSSLVAAFLVSLALMLASTVKPEKPLLQDMKTAITTVDSTRKLAVTASVGKVKEVQLTVRPVKSEAGATELGPFLLIPEEGMVHASISLDKVTFPLVVSLEWENASGTKMTLTKEIKDKAGAKQKEPPKKQAKPGPLKEQKGYATMYVNFEVDKWVIRPESEPTVKQVAQVLKDNPELNLIIAGHTDSSGTWGHNKILSENRAQAVIQALLARSIEAGRLVPVGHGQDKPIADNATEAGRAKNRRVELVKRE